MPTATRPWTWLGRYASFVAFATLGLIGIGGLVTSHGVGMAVPDWPTTYGYNMFLFPISQWVGGIFYEHTHRLWASIVGLLTVILAVWMQCVRPGGNLVRWGWVAVVLVIAQGVLGGMRVTLMRDQLGIFHGSLAQAFLVLLCLIAVGLSPRWQAWKGRLSALNGAERGALAWASVATGLVFLQLTLGATMRHQHAGLAVPDFPMAYGRWWPPSDEAFLQTVNARRSDVRDFNPITAGQIHLHMAHRGTALLVLGAVWMAGARLRRAFGARSWLGRLGWVWPGLVLVQGGLGALTVWSNKAADVATTHVVLGAVCLVLGAVAVASSRAAVLSRGRSTVMASKSWRKESASPVGGSSVSRAV